MRGRGESCHRLAHRAKPARVKTTETSLSIFAAAGLYHVRRGRGELNKKKVRKQRVCHPRIASGRRSLLRLVCPARARLPRN